MTRTAYLYSFPQTTIRTSSREAKTARAEIMWVDFTQGRP